MHKPEKKNESSAEKPAKQAPYDDLDTKLIVKLVVDQHIALKNFRIYPEKHDQVQKSLTQSYLSLQKALAAKEELTFGVTKDSLLLGEKRLSPGHAIIKEFAAVLKQHNIASVTYLKDLEKDELLKFLSILSRGTDTMAGSIAVESDFSQGALPHINIREIDYSQFHLTEKDEISGTPNGKEDPNHIWYDFITHYTAGTLTREKNGVTIDEIQHLSPSQLAWALNTSRIESSSALAAYDGMVGNHLQALSSQTATQKNDSKQMEGINCLLLELNPDLRRQFLSVTFKHCNSMDNASAVNSFLSSFSEGIVLDMLRQANEKNQEISPSLLKLIKNISDISGIPHESTTDLINPAENVHKREELESLFQREAHESYVSPEYDAMLNNVADASHQSPAIPEHDFDLARHIETMSSPQLDIKLARIILVFLNRSVSIDEYKDFSDRLTDGIGILLEAGEFGLLHNIATVFMAHKKNKSTPKLKKAAAQALAKLKNHDVISTAIDIFDKQRPAKSSKANHFLFALGPQIVPHILARIIRKDTIDESSHFINLLTHYRKETVEQIKPRLSDATVTNIAKILNLLRRINATEALDSVRPYLNDADSIIQLEALKTALHFSDPEAIPVLLHGIQSRSRLISHKAIQLAGDYRIKEMVPELLLKMKTKFMFFRSDYHQNGLILTALGKISDPAALPMIEKLASHSFSIYPKENNRMKKRLYASLEGYPFESITPLLGIGAKSKDKSIRAICNRMRKKAETT